MKGMFFAFAMFILSIFPASAQTIHPQSANSPKGGTVRGILFPKSSTTPDCPYDWRRPSIFYKQLDTNKFPIRLQSFFILYDGLTSGENSGREEFLMEFLKQWTAIIQENKGIFNTKDFLWV